MSAACIDYVCGFAFTGTLTEVALIRKISGPAGMAGKYNGFGGKIERDEARYETPRSSMEREFMEEAGLLIPGDDWLLFHMERHGAAHTGTGKEARIFFMAAVAKPSFLWDMKKMSDEGRPALVGLQLVRELPRMENLDYLIPMARNYLLYPQHRYLEG